MKEKIITFPKLGNYTVPITFILTKLTHQRIMQPKPITKQTIELGAKYSPDFICVPFKYNLGNYIEALEEGANVLIQAGGGCRFGYYAEVQEQILRDLGYEFDFYYLVEQNKSIIFSLYRVTKKINKKVSLIKYIYYLLLTLKMINYMDKIDIYIRANIGFEKNKGSFDKLLSALLNELTEIKGFFDLRKKYKKYLRLFKKIPLNKPRKCLKVGIIGELYTAMEPASTYLLERSLADMNIEISRYTNLTYLLITKLFNERKVLKRCGKYCKYTIGADGTDNIAVTRSLIKKGYDGLIHTKPFGCTPEVGAMIILQKISEECNVPIIYLSFDAQTSEEGLRTRLEAFYDMINMRRTEDD